MCWMCGTVERSFPSTTVGAVDPKLSRRPEGKQRAGGARRAWLGLPRRNWCEPLTLTLRVVRGGPEGWVEIKTRGGVKRYPVSACIGSIATEVNSR